MPLFNVLLARVDAFYRAMVAMVILTLLFRIQQNLHPYKKEENNQIEMLAVITGMVTLFSAIIFLDKIGDQEVEDIEFLQTISLIIIVFVNGYFVLRWFHVFLYSFHSKNQILSFTRRMLGWALFIKDSERMKTDEDTNLSLDKTKRVKNIFNDIGEKKQ